METKEIPPSEAKVLNYIRGNITLNRIKEVEEFLSEKGFLNLRKYFENWLMESVYRSHKGSYKIDYSKARGQTFLNCIIYILFGEPEIKMSLYPSKKLKTVLEKRLRKNSYFLRYSLRYLKTRTGDKNKKTGWINVEPYVYPILGGEIFFYCTLKALTEITKKILKNKNYSFPQCMNWREAIIYYLISEVIEDI
ncbi:hypothetical protein DRO69_14550 [Candidatus Bathyarchaeota archaeon]|nr:MAG: hypothetical protein DRO69_14550 [Candidatus Bathyarchaeota archaeon]